VPTSDDATTTDAATASELAARILTAAVTAIGGAERPGQVEMAAAVEQAIANGEHLLVQAGTGTGKSLGYLAPAFAHLAREPEARVIVATATLALQRQLATKDVPVVLDAVAQVTGRRPVLAVLKGRSNYACLHRVRDQVGGGPRQEGLLGGAEVVEALKATSADAESLLGAEVVALREWAETQLTDKQLADRDDAPSHTNRAWAQVSVPVRECLGVQRCPYGAECFVEESRDRARRADLIVTNHALLAIDAMHGHTALPEHDLVIVDEAHELVSRVTGAASAELSPQQIERVARRALDWLDDDVGLELLEVAEDLKSALDVAEVARVTDPDSAIVAALQRVRTAARAAASQLSKSGKGDDAERAQAGAAVDEVVDVAERMAKLADEDVVYVSERERFGRWLVVAPLSVAGLLRSSVMGEVGTILTSATLKVGGDFEAVAGQVGLRRSERVDGDTTPPGEDALPWRGLDVGSPFDYRKQGICYVAKHLDRPGRDGISAATLAEVAELVWASSGGALGLFASQRSAEQAASHVRAALPERTVLCQGDAQLSELMKRFSSDPEVSLFGTLSLWQGIDVPGHACELVIIDKIPFPRPDDPLMLARQQHVERSGGNGFMQVAAAHAGLLLAQGAGRLIRRMSDRGVVAILDPRLVTARYGAYLRASLPDFWTTTDREATIAALQRLAAARTTAL